MNKTNWVQVGGVPLRNEDWKYEQDAVREALQGIASMLGNHAHLSGVSVHVGIPTTWTAGFIVLNGEVMYVAAGSINSNVNVFGNTYFELVEEDDAEGAVVLENGGNAFLYKMRRATITTYNDPQAIGATRQLWTTVMGVSLYSKVLDYVQNNANQFTKIQSWKEKAQVINVPSGVLSLDLEANSYRVNAPHESGISSIINDSFAQDGTIITVNLQGNSGDSFFVVHGSNVEVSGGRTAVFLCNSTIQFIKSNNKWRLMSTPEAYGS